MNGSKAGNLPLHGDASQGRGRIVSLIPEATEILGALGLGGEVVTVSREDAQDGDRLAVVLREAQPTLVFTSETSAGGGLPRHLVRRQIALTKPMPRPAVYALEPRSVGGILSDVKTVGDAVGRQGAARTLIEGLRARIDAVSLRSARALAEGEPRRVVVLQGSDPPVAAGWWLAELVGLAGGFDVLDGIGRPPRVVTWEQIQAARPDLVIVVGTDEEAASTCQGPARSRSRYRPGSSTDGAQAPARLRWWYGDARRPGSRCGVAAYTADTSEDREHAATRCSPSQVVWAQSRGIPGGEVLPGPSAVGLLEDLMALILHQSSGSLDQPERQA